MSNNINLDFKIGDLSVSVGKDYGLSFQAHGDPSDTPYLDAKDIQKLHSKLSELLQYKMLGDFANETPEQAEYRRVKNLNWIADISKDA